MNDENELEMLDRTKLYMEKRIDSDGEYMEVMYDKQAQQFIVDNMDAVVDRICK